MTRRFTAQGTNVAFRCARCGLDVPPLGNGSYRNHCPRCLYSLHVDVFPGDRANDCHGLLKPIGVEQNAKKGWIIVHECQKCGFQGRNKAALDDPDQPDDYDLVVRLASSRDDGPLLR